MHAIMDWIKGFIILYLMLTILMHLSAADPYKKYLRFFSGMILLLMLLQPAMRLFGKEGRLEALISNAIFWEQLDSIRQDTQKLEFIQADHYREKYEKAIAEDMLAQASGQGLHIREMQVSLTEDYEISYVTVYLESSIESFMESFMESSMEASSGQDLEVEKEQIADFLQQTYALEENQIFIN